MKLNKVSLNNIVKNSKVDFLAHSKYYLATIGLILLSAIVVISIIGMRLGFEFNGGTVIEVVYNVDAGGTMYNEEQAKEGVESAIANFGLDIYTVQTEESSFGDKVIFKLNNNLSEQEYTALRTTIYEVFNSYDEGNIIQSQYINVYGVNGAAGDTAVYASIALSVAIVLAALGILLRYGLSQAIAALIVMILNALSIFAFVIIARIVADVSFIASVVTVFVLTVISMLVFFDKVRENKKNPDYKEFTKNQHSNLAIREVFWTLFLTFIVSLIGVVLITGLGVVPIRNFGLPVLFGLFVISLSAIYALPYFWTILNINIKRKKKSK